MKISKKWGGNDSAGWPPVLVADVGGDRGEGGPGVLLLVLHFFCCLFPAVAKGLIDEGCQPMKRLCFFFLFDPCTAVAPLSVFEMVFDPVAPRFVCRLGQPPRYLPRYL